MRFDFSLAKSFACRAVNGNYRSCGGLLRGGGSTTDILNANAKSNPCHLIFLWKRNRHASKHQAQNPSKKNYVYSLGRGNIYSQILYFVVVETYSERSIIITRSTQYIRYHCLDSLLTTGLPGFLHIYCQVLHSLLDQYRIS